MTTSKLDSGEHKLGVHYVLDSGDERAKQWPEHFILLFGGDICYCAPDRANQKHFIESFFQRRTLPNAIPTSISQEGKFR